MVYRLKSGLKGAVIGGAVGGIAEGANALYHGRNPFTGAEINKHPKLTGRLITPRNELNRPGPQIKKEIETAVPKGGEKIEYNESYPKVYKLEDKYHCWGEDQVRIVGDNGRIFQITGGDGINRTLIQMPGNLDGTPGIYELIIYQGQITHQMFIPNGQITGCANQKF